MAPPDRHLRCGGSWTPDRLCRTLTEPKLCFQSRLSTLTGFSGSNPGGQSFPQVVQRGCSRRESEEWRVHCTHGRSGPFPASSFQVERSEGVCFCPPGGRASCQVIFPPWSHTRWSAADLSSCTTARSWEADWASFPTSVVGAIVARFLCVFLLPPPPPLRLWVSELHCGERRREGAQW